MGEIMAIGVASAIRYCWLPSRASAVAGHDGIRRSKISAGSNRIRQVMMTRRPRYVGMIPMAIGGAGEEQKQR